MNILVIGWNGIKLVLREPRALFWMFFGPLLTTIFFGIMFRPPVDRPPTLTIVNHDATENLAQRLTATLEPGRVSVVRSDRVVADSLSLEIPEGAGEQFAAGKGVKLILHASDAETNVERNVRFTIQRAIVGMYLQPATSQIESRALPSTPLVVVQQDIVAKPRPLTAGFQRSVPAYLVMFVFMNLLISGAGIAEERALGLMRRLAIAPITRSEILLGKLFSRFLTGWIQIGYMLIIGLILGIHWADHPLVLFAFLSLFALASASTGILIGTLFDDPDKCISAAVWTTLLLAPLGGLWWPIEIVGPTMRRISYFVPTGWAMESVNAMLAFGADARDIAPAALAFAAMFGVTFTLAARRLKG